MRIAYEEAGGLAGLVRGCELDTGALAAHEAAQLNELVEQANVWTLLPAPPRGRVDATQYQIVIQDSGRRREIVLTDSDLTPAINALVCFLRQRSQPRRP